MRFNRLRIENFAAIDDLDVEFGPGLNVLYGPNDLGKSTVVNAIRVCLLLPHASAGCDQYVGWTGGGVPEVELMFQTEAQRVWRVLKRFGQSGKSLLQESRNGKDFDDVEHGRKVDGKLREILRWGISEPGGAGGSRGLPASFLATALLSPQDDVSAVLQDSLHGDQTGTGKEQIAAALQAIAQDPLFVALLRETQAHRDAAYTDKGAKKTAKGSVFKAAADRVNETRVERDRLQSIVSESDGVEMQLRDLTTRRTNKQEDFAEATRQLEELEKLVAQAADRAVAEEWIQLAKQELLDIQKIGTEAEQALRRMEELKEKIDAEEEALKAARSQQEGAEAELRAAEEGARAEESDPGSVDTIVRQQLELRKSAASQAAGQAQQRIDAALTAQKLATAADDAEQNLRRRQREFDAAQESASNAIAKLNPAENELRRCDLLERALDLHAADEEAKIAQFAVEKKSSLQGRLEELSAELAVFIKRRAAIRVPTSGALLPMRRLTQTLNVAMAALDVGILVTVSPKTRLDLRVRKDGQDVDSAAITQPLDIEASSEVQLYIADIATVHVSGGRREAQNRARELKERWNMEVEPHLIAAGVSGLEALEQKIEEAQALDVDIKDRKREMESLRNQIGELSGAAEKLCNATDRLAACRGALENVQLDSLAAEITALGGGPNAGLRKRREKLSTEVIVARGLVNDAEKERTLAGERSRQGEVELDSARAARDSALTAFPGGVDAALVAAQASLVASAAEKESVTAEFASLENTINERKRRIEAALTGARTNSEQAKIAVRAAEERLTTSKTDHAAEHGRLIELRKQRDAENLPAAETKLQEATQRHAALPVPDRIVTDDEVNAARTAAAGIKHDLEDIDDGILRAHGALEQVGGAVARERLRDATEAFEMAQLQERETEAEYEAWKLLLDQMKEADADQASNLGQALAPAIADQFQELTQRRYQTVQLTSQLATEGIIVSGALRQTAQISVGTREQLSTLYRLALAEYLRTVIVLDDQLVQSDDSRMDWFRELLTEKARSFQIVVFTCRPSDYLPPSALVPQASAVHTDTDGGFIRAVDLGRALHRR